MSPTLQDLKNAASSLPVSERADLAQYLLRSLDEQNEDGARAEWLTLAEQRMAEVRAGRVVAIPAEEVLWNLLDPVKNPKSPVAPRQSFRSPTKWNQLPRLQPD